MPPPLALALTLLFIAYLFRRDFRQEYKPSRALWIPCIWMLILGSRSVTEWVNLGTPVSGSDIAEGSPLDRAVYFLLIGLGVVVLAKRRISWSQLFRDNMWLVILFVYGGISIVWSDFPFVTFKRWTKAFGDPIMVLILLTEHEPIKAIERLLKRCAYVLLPLSVLFIKYYPHIGRGFSEWTGAGYNVGVTGSKNLLGFVLMILGLFLVWRFTALREGDGKSGKWIDDAGIPALLLGMDAWLFSISDSKTSLLSLSLALLVFLGLGLRHMRSYVGTYAVLSVLIFSVLEALFNLSETIIESAGRDATLTGRIELWDVVFRMQQQPILGYGFETFWLGDRLKYLHSLWASFKPTQAHNGYIQMYLDLGWVGPLIMAGVMATCYVNMRKMLNGGPERKEEILFGRFGMAFLSAYIVYNYTEAAFKSVHFLFVILLLFTVRVPQLASRIPRWPVRSSIQ